MAEAGGDEGAEIVGFDLGGDEYGQALPGVARTLDDFDVVAHEGQTNGTDEGIKFGGPFGCDWIGPHLFEIWGTRRIRCGSCVISF